MRFDMVGPCDMCPFRNDLAAGYLTEDRLVEIVSSLFDQKTFPCHKTTEDIEEDDGSGARVVVEDSQACAGAEIFLLKQHRSTQLGRIAERFGLAATLDVDAPICGSLQELLEVHRDDH